MNTARSWHPLPWSLPVTVRRALVGMPAGYVAPPASIRAGAAEKMKLCKPGMSLSQSTGSAGSFSWVRASLDRPCMTIQKKINFGGFSIWHPNEERALDARETARLGSWPDEFQFVGDYEAWIARIGNSVPPLFIRAIAWHIREFILTPIQAQKECAV